MEKIQLQTQVRELNTRDNKALSRKGMIPAELYGHNVQNIHLSLNANEFDRVLRKAGESTIIELVLPDGGIRNVLIHDVQKHYLKSHPIHVDFYEVKMTEKLTATVQLEFFGESNAVKALGGTLVKNITEVEVECLPADLPHQIDVDISTLNTFEDVILVKDLNVSDKVEVKAEADEMVAKVQPPRDVEAELAEPIVEDISAVEGAAEDKPAEEGAEGAEGAGGEGEAKE